MATLVKTFQKKKSFLAFFGDPFFHCQVVKFFHKKNKNKSSFSEFLSFLGGVKKKKLTSEQKIMII
jgi:hypothetical protein